MKHTSSCSFEFVIRASRQRYRGQVRVCRQKDSAASRTKRSRDRKPTCIGIGQRNDRCDGVRTGERSFPRKPRSSGIDTSDGLSSSRRSAFGNWVSASSSTHHGGSRRKIGGRRRRFDRPGIEVSEDVHDDQSAGASAVTCASLAPSAFLLLWNDTPTRVELAAARLTSGKSGRMVGADSLEYLPEELARDRFGENGVCTACFSGKYLEVGGDVRDVAL